MDEKTKLTLSLRKSVIQRGKEYAARRGTSLSQLVEDELSRLEGADGLTFSQRWGGKFAKRKRPGDPRMEYLERRYEGLGGQRRADRRGAPPPAVGQGQRRRPGSG